MRNRQGVSDEKMEDAVMKSALMKERDAMHRHFERLMPETAKCFDDLMSLTFSEGALSSQEKELIALGISVAVRCEPCMNYHIEKARAKGASDEKLLEAMNVGFEMGVGQLIPPLRKVLRSQFPSREGEAKGAGAGPARAAAREARAEADEAVRQESGHRMWTLY